MTLYDCRFDHCSTPVLLNPDNVCTVAKAADMKWTYEFAAALSATRSIASIFTFKIEPWELIFVLDLNPDLALVSGRKELASAPAKLGFESVIAILSETEISGLDFFVGGRGLCRVCLARRRWFRGDLSLLPPRPRFSLLDSDGWSYCRSGSEAFELC